MPRPKGELYLVDQAGFEYGFNADMAKHTTLYAVMRDGVRVPWTGSPPVQGGPQSNVLLADDKFPTEAELLQAKALSQRSGQDLQAEQVAMAAQANQAGQGAAMPGSVRIPQAQTPSVEGNDIEAGAAPIAGAEPVATGRVEPPSTVGGTPPADYEADMPLNPAPMPAPPLPPRRTPPRPPSRV
jgi:hypothetical protein